jgi:serine/threonine protein kinase
MTRRYEPLLKIASGGTAAVYVGAAAGALGFRQLVAIKRPHAHLADDPAFVAALLAEARIAARLRHANVVDVRDVEADDDGVDLVMDYVEGASLSDLIRSWKASHAAVAIRIVLDASEGLRSAHDLADDEGRPLGLVHRDVSPANILVGIDGVARIADFGLAKPLLAAERTTSEGGLRGKLGYMAPEYIRGKKDIDRRIDVFAMGIVLWEAIARKRLFRGENDGDTLERVQRMSPPALEGLGAAGADLDLVIGRALAKDPADRYATIESFAADLARAARTHGLQAAPTDVRESFGVSLLSDLEDRRRRVTAALNGESTPSRGSRHPSRAPLPLAPDQASLSAALVAGADRAGNTTSEPATGADSSSPDGFSASARGERRTSMRVLGVAAGALLIAGVAGVALARGDSGVRVLEPRVLAPDLQRRVDPVLMRAASTTPETTSPSRRVAATSDEPGKKAPRPNPYARMSGP